jgi:hypothetical protein
MTNVSFIKNLSGWRTPSGVILFLSIALLSVSVYLNIHRQINATVMEELTDIHSYLVVKLKCEFVYPNVLKPDVKWRKKPVENWGKWPVTG